MQKQVEKPVIQVVEKVMEVPQYTIQESRTALRLVGLVLLFIQQKRP